MRHTLRFTAAKCLSGRSVVRVVSLMMFVWFTATRGNAEPFAEIGQVLEFQQRYCAECHAGEDAEADLDLANDDVVRAMSNDMNTHSEKWETMARRVFDREMPPIDSNQPSDSERNAYVEWIQASLRDAACGDGIAPGPALLRRLNRNEYAATLRDLLGIQIDVSNALPADGAGGEGFDNAAETLFISPIHAEKYLDAARKALTYALSDPRTRGRVLSVEPTTDVSASEAAEKVLRQFLPRAFRRPVTEQEVHEYHAWFNEIYQTDPSFNVCIQATLEAILLSPQFLFRIETRAETPGPALLTDHELASRLSYFLWTTMPDDELLQVADSGRLNDAEVLRQQVRRMLQGSEDDRGRRRSNNLHGFSQSFIEQWLGTRALGREFKPDPSVARRYDSELEGGMKYEPVFFFEEILSEDHSLLKLIDADFTYVNRRLARHYRIEGEFREQPKRTELSPDSHRGGLLGMSAVLAVSSYPHRTSPVLRGKWVLETLLGAPPPPPPPNVPPLEETSDANSPSSLRERLEQHRANQVCASCHDRIDPLGFGLENYDVLGRWRTEVDGIEIDNRGKLPDGTEFAGPEELKQVLLNRKDQFVRNLTEKMLGFALGRGLTNEDACTVDQIVADLKANDYRSHVLVLGIVESIPFRYKPGQEPGLPVETTATNEE